MNCKYCEAVIESCRMEVESNELVVCPDGYDENWMPLSGKQKLVRQCGQTHFYALPCNCPITREDAEQLNKTELIRKQSK